MLLQQLHTLALRAGREQQHQNAESAEARCSRSHAALTPELS